MSSLLLKTGKYDKNQDCNCNGYFVYFLAPALLIVNNPKPRITIGSKLWEWEHIECLAWPRQVLKEVEGHIDLFAPFPSAVSAPDSRFHAMEHAWGS